MNARLFLHQAVIAGILSSFSTYAVLPLYTVRSQAQNNARRLAGYVHHTTFFDDQCAINGSLAITPGYTRSFSSHAINTRLFGQFLSCDDDFISISGSTVTNRGAQDLLADYFYLPTDFKSTVSFKPVVDSFLIDMQFHLELNAWLEGLYIFINAPFEHSRWNLQACETVTNFGVANSPAGYFAQTELARSQFFQQFQDYAEGNAVFANDTGLFFDRLSFAKMRFGRVSRGRVAAVQFGMGYYCEQNDTSRLGIQLYGVGPTGIRPSGEYLFEPYIGNGHHWEVGFGIEGQYYFTGTAHSPCSISCAWLATISHLFKTHQIRTFDLIDKPLSRYMLAEKLGTPIVDGLQSSSGTVPSAQFQNRLTPVANITSLPVFASVAVQGDAVFAFSARYHNTTIDIGYDIWAQSREALSFIDLTSVLFDGKTWALKGDAHVFGFVPTSTTAVALSATQSKATIHSGTNPTAPAISRNDGVDNAQGACNAPASILVFAPNTPSAGINQINSSFNPVFISLSDLDIHGAQTKGLSQSLFMHIDHTWHDRRYCTPYLGLGGQVEWRGFHSYHASCLSQWGLWLKGGITFE